MNKKYKVGDRVSFKYGNNKESTGKGYIWTIIGDYYQISENKETEAIGFCQNWKIHINDIIETL